MGMEQAIDSRWVLTGDERILVMSKNRAQRLPFGLLLLFYRSRGQFPKASGEIDQAAAQQVAGQLEVPVGESERGQSYGSHRRALSGANPHLLRFPRGFRGRRQDADGMARRSRQPASERCLII